MISEQPDKGVRSTMVYKRSKLTLLLTAELNSQLINALYPYRVVHITRLAIMPWTKKDYPVSLKNFMAPVRNKAIEIANALLADGSEEQRAIAIATAKAEEWATNRGLKVRKANAPERKTNS